MLPRNWDDRMKYFYRKLAGSGNQNLIDKMEECLDILRNKKPLTAPYTRDDIIKIMRVAKYILQEEREVDIVLAQKIYNELLKEIGKKKG